MSNLRNLSFRAQLLAVRVAGLSQIERLTLVAIATYADKVTGLAWPTEVDLAANTSMGVRTVRNAIKSLERLGILKVTRRGRRKPNQYVTQNQYVIQIDTLETMAMAVVKDHGTGTTCRSQTPERPEPDDRVTGTSRPEMTGTTCRLTVHTATAQGTVQTAAAAPASACALESSKDDGTSPRARLAFDAKTQQITGIEQADLQRWGEAFPDVTISVALKRAALHLIDHPGEYTDISAFLRRWFARDQEDFEKKNPGGVKRPPATPGTASWEGQPRGRLS